MQTDLNGGRRWIWVVAWAGIAQVAGCQTLQDYVAGAEKPSAKLRNVSLQGLSADAADLALDVEVTNPYAVPLPLLDLDYGLESRGAVIVSGRAEPQGPVPAQRSRRITVPAEVRFAELLDTLAGVRPGEVLPYTARATLVVDAPGLGSLDLPLRTDGELPVPAVPTVELTSIAWETLSLQEATAVLNLRVENPNAFAADLSRLDYGLRLAGQPIVETGLAQRASFAAGGAQDLQIPVSFRPMDLGLAVMNILSGQSASYELGGTMRFDTPYGPLELPFERSGRTAFTR